MRYYYHLNITVWVRLSLLRRVLWPACASAACLCATAIALHFQRSTGNVFEVAELLDQVLPPPPPLSRVLLEVPLPTSGVPDSTKDRRTSSPYMLPLVTSSLVVVGPPFLSCSWPLGGLRNGTCSEYQGAGRHCYCTVMQVVYLVRGKATVSAA